MSAHHLCFSSVILFKCFSKMFDNLACLKLLAIVFFGPMDTPFNSRHMLPKQLPVNSFMFDHYEITNNHVSLLYENYVCKLFLILINLIIVS